MPRPAPTQAQRKKLPKSAPITQVSRSRRPQRLTTTISASAEAAKKGRAITVSTTSVQRIQPRVWGAGRSALFSAEMGPVTGTGARSVSKRGSRTAGPGSAGGAPSSELGLTSDRGRRWCPQ